MTSPEQSPISAASILRAATAEHIPQIMAIERAPEFHALVGVWTEEEHLRAIHDPDVRYFLLAGGNNESAGFAILRGIQSPHRNIELKRIAIAEPGRGLGRKALAALMEHGFCQLHAHRLWLDVFETNVRALRVYRNAGFRQEGILREAIYRDGEFHTLYLMSILDREYFAERGG